MRVKKQTFCSESSRQRRLSKYCEGVALEMGTVLRLRKDKLIYSILSESKIALDSCVTENNFSVVLSIHFLTSLCVALEVLIN